MKKLLAIVLVLSFISSISGYAFETDSILSATAEVVYENTKSPSVGSVGGEWAVIGITKSGYPVPAEYYLDYIDNLRNYLKENDGVLHSVKYTEYSRVVIALAAMGLDPSDFDDINFVQPLFDEEKVYAQGINGAIWALIALDSINYPGTDEIRNSYINEILKNELSAGGWSLGGFEEADADITAMALTALARHADIPEADAAVDRGISLLSAIQTESGGFYGSYGESSESCAQVIIALCSLGISTDDPRFIKNGKTPLDNLMSFYNGSGGFLHTLSGSDVSMMGTEQALCALAAVKRIKEVRPAVFDMSDAVPLVTLSNSPIIGLEGKHSDVKQMPVINPGKTFSDISNNSAKAEIEALASRAIINGMDDISFAPNNSMTRAEYATIIVRGLGLEARQTDKFSDVPADEWFSGYVGSAYQYGIVNGVSDTEFNPTGTITREEAAVMTARAAKLCGLSKEYALSGVRDVLAGFVDYIFASDWAAESLALCYDLGILQSEDIEIRPKDEATRSEIAQMLYNMLNESKLL